MSEQVTFDEGKYTIKIEDDASVVLLRWGEMWDEHPLYPKMLIAILYEFQELQERLERNPDYCGLWSRAVEHGEGLLEEKRALAEENEKLRRKVKELEKRNTELGRVVNPDRMGR